LKKAKYLLIAAAGMVMTVMLTAPVMAAGNDPVTVTITDTAEPSQESGVQEASGPGYMDTGGQKATPYPTDIQLVEQGERNYLYKSYTVAASYDPDQLVEPVFSQGGYRYRFSEIIQRDSTPASASKTVTESRTVNSETDDQASILALLGNKLPYSDADGYKGELFLVPESLMVSETGRSSYSYTVSDTRSFDGLANNDMANIPKTVNKNGMTLGLQTVDWQVTGSEGMGYSDVPTGYTAVAYYSAPATGTKASGYVATASFSGEAMKELIGKNTYTIVYEGEQIIIPFNYIPLIIAGVIIAGCIVACIVFWRLRKNVRVYVYQAGVPELYAKLRVSPREPKIDLRQLSDVEIRLVFDKGFTKKMLNQRVFIISKYKNTRFDLDASTVDLRLDGVNDSPKKKEETV